jgi:hypothetical protein
MSAVWISVVVVGLATIAIKAAGPLLLARRTPPPRARAALEHLAPALLAGAELVVVMGYDQLDPATARRTEDWCIDDPRHKDADAVRCIRDAIDRRVRSLLIRMGVALPTRPH